MCGKALRYKHSGAASSDMAVDTHLPSHESSRAFVLSRNVFNRVQECSEIYCLMLSSSYLVSLKCDFDGSRMKSREKSSMIRKNCHIVETFQHVV